MIVVLLAVSTLMLVESVIVYSYPGIYRLLFGLLEKCSRPAAAAGALLCGSCAVAALALALRARTPEREYLGWLGGLMMMALGFMLFVVVCLEADLRHQLREQIASIPLSKMRAYALAAFFLNLVFIAALIGLAGF